MEHSSPSSLFHSSSSPSSLASKSIEFEPVSIPDDKLHEIVRQFTNAQELADLQADIFGCSSQSLHDCAPTLTLPSFLEPIASDRSTRKRKLSESTSAAGAGKKQLVITRDFSVYQPQAASASANNNNNDAAGSAKRRKTDADTDAASASYKPQSTAAAADSGSNSSKMNHNRSERERRQKINESIDQLRLLLPPQCQEVAGNKLAILQESVGYMRHLKDSLATIQTERQRADDAYRRLWEEYRHLRHYLSLYSYPDPHHVHHCVLPPFHTAASLPPLGMPAPLSPTSLLGSDPMLSHPSMVGGSPPDASTSPASAAAAAAAAAASVAANEGSPSSLLGYGASVYYGSASGTCGQCTGPTCPHTKP